MNTLILHYHPLSSYCQKVLIALDELGIELDARILNLGDTEERARFFEMWPLGKMPVLVDQGRAIPETSIIIEHLQRHHARGGATLLPDDAQQALDVRLWDRLSDFHVMTPMQALTADLLRPEHDRDPTGTAQARDRLGSAYALLNDRLEGQTWITGTAFTMADCALAPALFYAFTYVPLPAGLHHLADYFERLVSRPSVARTIEHARPFFRFYPGRAGLQARFLAQDGR